MGKGDPGVRNQLSLMYVCLFVLNKEHSICIDKAEMASLEWKKHYMEKFGWIGTCKEMFTVEFIYFSPTFSSNCICTTK